MSPSPSKSKSNQIKKTAKVLILGNSLVGQDIVRTFIDKRAQTVKESHRVNTVVEYCKSVIVDNPDGTETKLKLKLVVVEDDQKMFDMAHLFVKDV